MFVVYLKFIFGWIFWFVFKFGRFGEDFKVFFYFRKVDGLGDLGVLG